MAKRKVRATTLAEWLVMCEQAIAWHTTPPRTRGKYKGHGSTDSVAWMTAMLKLMQADIRRTRKGIGYDENMALASLAGLVFAAWYANVHRAKALDPNRPLVGRRRALKAREAWVRAFHTSLTNDRLMAQVWGHQEFNLPYGAKAKGGKFV